MTWSASTLPNAPWQTKRAPNRSSAICRLLTWYLNAADALGRVFNPDHAHLSFDPPASSCKPPAFTTHLQAWHWAESEFANLAPVLRQAATAGGDTLAWQLPYAFAIIFDLFGRFADLIPGLRSAVAVTQKLGDRHVEARSLANLAEAYLNVHQLDEAIEYSQAAFAIYAETGDWYGQWSARGLEGIASLFHERLSEALDRLQQSLAIARQASDPRTEGMSLTWLGEVHERLGSVETAIRLREQAVAALEQGRNKWQYAFALENLADAYQRHGRSSEAIGNYQHAQAIFCQIGDRRTQASILFQLGHAQKTTGQDDAARKSWQQSLAIFEELHDTRADQVRNALVAEAGRS